MENQPKYLTKRVDFFLKSYDADEGHLEGFAAVMGHPDEGQQVIDMGAFRKSLRARKGRQRLCWQHDFREPIGKPDMLREVGKDRLPPELLEKFPLATGALYFEVDIVETQRGKDARVLLREGVIDEMSIGYNLEDGGTYDGEDGYTHLKEIDLIEISVVTMAMQPAARVVSFKAQDTEAEPELEVEPEVEQDTEPKPSFELELEPTEGKPYPNEHSCRLRSPDDFQDDSFRRIKREHEGKEYSVIMGRLKGETTMTEQAYRYAKDVWESGEARKHCRDHDGTFEAAQAALEEPSEFKGVIPFRDTGKDSEDAEWDAGEEVRQAEIEDLKIMCAWFAGEGDVKGDYKLPHHRAGGGHRAVWRGVAAAGAVIMGARGGADIPGGDIPGVKRHLGRHYAQFDKVPPWESESDAIRLIQEGKYLEALDLLQTMVHNIDVPRPVLGRAEELALRARVLEAELETL